MAASTKILKIFSSCLVTHLIITDWYLFWPHTVKAVNWHFADRVNWRFYSVISINLLFSHTLSMILVSEMLCVKALGTWKQRFYSFLFLRFWRVRWYHCYCISLLLYINWSMQLSHRPGKKTNDRTCTWCYNFSDIVCLGVYVCK